jgi:hypothetical protein
MESFPRQIVGRGADTLVSTLMVNVKDNESGEEEQALLTSVLEIKRGSPRVQADGRSGIDLKRVRWTAKGPSRSSGKTIEYVVTPPQRQPRSEVVANQATTHRPIGPCRASGVPDCRVLRGARTVVRSSTVE